MHSNKIKDSDYYDFSKVEKDISKDDDDDEPKQSLSSHINSTIVTTFFVIILTLTCLLFVWSNYSDGAYVELYVSPFIASSSTNSNSSLSSSSMSILDLDILLQKNKINILSELSSLLSSFSSSSSSSSSLLRLDDSCKTDENLPCYTASIFSFTLMSSVKDFWSSKAYSLAILIALFSGLWPYVKLVFLMIVLLQPMKVKTRQRILLVLDQLGKFSMIDLYVCVFMVVSFYLRIKKQTQNLGIHVNITVEPDVGMNTFVIGTLLSMIYTHVFVYLDENRSNLKWCGSSNNNYVRSNSIEKENENENIKNIQEHSFANDDDNNENWNSYKPFFIRYIPFSGFGIIIRALILVAIISTLYATIDVIFTAPVRYDIDGLAGMAVTDNHRAYNIWQVFKDLPSRTDKKASAYFLAIVWFLTLVIFPILNNIMALLLWFLPIKNLKLFKIIYNCLIPFQSWSALDVFVIASIAASFELQRVSEWIIDQNFASTCGDNGIITNIFHDDCFTVIGYVLNGTWYMLGAVISYWIIWFYTLHYVAKYFKTRRAIQLKKEQSFP